MKKTSLLAALVTAVLLCPRTSTAMDIQMFDLLMDEDQREYVEYLLDVARKVFIEMDREDAAEKVTLLFEEVPAGADLTDRRRSDERHPPAHAAFCRRTWAASPALR